MPDASGNGYWLVTATGHVYAFGDAVNYGAPGPQSVPVTSAVRTTDGGGYWILFANGTVDGYVMLRIWAGQSEPRLASIPPRRSSSLQTEAATGWLRPTDPSTTTVTLRISGAWPVRI